MVGWNKLRGCWQLKDKKNSLLTIYNYLWKPSGITLLLHHDNFALMQDVAWKTCRQRWTTEINSEIGSGKSVQEARHHHDDDILYVQYISINCMAFCFIWGTDKWGILLVRSFYVTQVFREWSFCWTGFCTWSDFFRIHLTLIWSSDFLSLILKTWFLLIQDSLKTDISDWLTNHRLFHIFLQVFDWLANQMCCFASMGRVFLSHFNWYFNQTTI